ncbi:hypothetical protein BRARA_A01410 [Brassica rapa]|uniref:3-oxoacyl-[acyl-carrier-protein] reductase n=1 Tax=Brassica campestris TaxID=3711 RepID=A0A398ASL3_BRACM|nr:hypothetical protein BRARA_A01410 [Brassica rapa]
MIDTGRYLIGAAGVSGFGSKSTADEVTENCDLRSTTAIITGATSGIGAETARVLAKRGARLIFPARNVKAAEEAKGRIVSEFPGTEIVVMELDLSSMSSVRSFVAGFESLHLPLNLLINNAGRLAHEHAISEDGIEMTFATNYLGHFLLTNLLLKKMVQTAEETGVQGRIVNVTSGIHGWFTGDLIEYLRLISQPKWRKLQKIGANVTVNCVHPGVVKTRLTRDREGLMTDLVFFLTSKLLKTVPQAAATTCYVATNPRLVNVSGKYFTDCNETTPSGLGSNSSEATKLWAASEILVTQHPKAAFDPFS